MARHATHWLRPNVGTDVAWINGLMHVIIAEGLHDQAFVESSHRRALKRSGRRLHFTPPSMWKQITGIPAAELVAAARLYARAEHASILYCMGITQHTTGTDNVKSLANLAMLCGNIGMPEPG